MDHGQISLRCNDEASGVGMIEKSARRVVSVSRHVIYGCCVVPTLDLRSVDEVTAAYGARYDDKYTVVGWADDVARSRTDM